MEKFKEEKLAEFRERFANAGKTHKGTLEELYEEADNFIIQIIDSSFRAGEEEMKRKVLEWAEEEIIETLYPGTDNEIDVIKEKDMDDLKQFLKL